MICIYIYICIASSMSETDIDNLYKRFSSDLTQDISKEKHNIDDMQSRVESITTKFSQLRTENMEMLKVISNIMLIPN